MEVTHVLVGIMPSGSIIYGISGHGCNSVGLLENLTTFRARPHFVNKNEISLDRFARAYNLGTSRIFNTVEPTVLRKNAYVIILSLF